MRNSSSRLGPSVVCIAPKLLPGSWPNSAEELARIEVAVRAQQVWKCEELFVHYLCTAAVGAAVCLNCVAEGECRAPPDSAQPQHTCGQLLPPPRLARCLLTRVHGLCPLFVHAAPPQRPNVLICALCLIGARNVTI